jgi:hypothetical protein
VSGEHFKPLDLMRAVRDDKVLSATQRHLLHVASLRADSDSDKGREAGRVRASLELLATDAGLSSKSAERAFRDEHVLSYFRRVERSTRQVNLWFRLRDSGQRVRSEASSKQMPNKW